MARKQQQETGIEPVPTENNELSEYSDVSEMNVVNPMRDKVRPMPDSDWDTRVTEMHDYISAHHDLINVSLQKNAGIAAKFVVSKKTSRSTAQTKSAVVLRDDIPSQPTPTQETETVKQQLFPRNRRIKRAK